MIAFLKAGVNERAHMEWLILTTGRIHSSQRRQGKRMFDDTEETVWVEELRSFSLISWNFPNRVMRVKWRREEGKVWNWLRGNWLETQCFWFLKGKSIMCNHMDPSKVRKRMTWQETALKGESQHWGLPTKTWTQGSVIAARHRARRLAPEPRWLESGDPGIEKEVV